MSFEAIVDDGPQTTDDTRLTSNDHNSSPSAIGSGELLKVRERAKIRNRYNQAPHLTQDNNGKVTSQIDITNESQEVSPFPAGDHKASTNRHA